MFNRNYRVGCVLIIQQTLWKNSNFRNFCWMVRTQPISLLKLFLLYIHKAYHKFDCLYVQQGLEIHCLLECGPAYMQFWIVPNSFKITVQDLLQKPVWSWALKLIYASTFQILIYIAHTQNIPKMWLLIQQVLKIHCLVECGPAGFSCRWVTYWVY